jgi:hypothetical protein
MCVYIQGTLRGFTTAAAAATLTLEVAAGCAVTAVVLRPSAAHQLLAAAADGTMTLWGWPREGAKGDAAASPTLLRKWRLGAPIDHVVLLNDVSVPPHPLLRRHVPLHLLSTCLLPPVCSAVECC